MGGNTLLTYRQADKADIPKLIDMRLAFLSEEHGELTAEQTHTIESQLQVYFREHLNRDLLVYVCEDDATIVSTVFLLVSERPANPNILTGLTGTLLNVFTLPRYRNRGIAGNLVKMTIQYAKDNKLSYIDLKATQAGYSLYRKLGFVPDESSNVPMKYRFSRE